MCYEVFYTALSFDLASLVKLISLSFVSKGWMTVSLWNSKQEKGYFKKMVIFHQGEKVLMESEI